MDAEVVCQVPAVVHIKHDGQLAGAEKISHEVNVCVTSTGSTHHMSISQRPALVSSDSRLSFNFASKDLSLIGPPDPESDNQYCFILLRRVKAVVDAKGKKALASMIPLIRVWCSIPLNDLPAGAELVINLEDRTAQEQTHHSIKVAKDLLATLGNPRTHETAAGGGVVGYHIGDCHTTSSGVLSKEIKGVLPAQKNPPMWLDLTPLQHLVSEPKQGQNVVPQAPRFNTRRGAHSQPLNQNTKSQSRPGSNAGSQIQEERHHLTHGWTEFAAQGSLNQTKKVEIPESADLELQKARVSNDEWWKEGKENTRWKPQVEGGGIIGNTSRNTLYPGFEHRRSTCVIQPQPAARFQHPTAAVSSARPESTIGELDRSKVFESQAGDVHGQKARDITQDRQQSIVHKGPSYDSPATNDRAGYKLENAPQHNNDGSGYYPRKAPIKKKRGGALFDSI